MNQSKKSTVSDTNQSSQNQENEGDSPANIEINISQKSRVSEQDSNPLALA